MVFLANIQVTRHRRYAHDGAGTNEEDVVGNPNLERLPVAGWTQSMPVTPTFSDSANASVLGLFSTGPATWRQDDEQPPGTRRRV